MKNNSQSKMGIVALIILSAALCRLLSPFANVTPIGAMALFGGVYCANRWQSIALPLASLWISDLILNNVVYKAYFPTFTLFSMGSIFVYASVAATAVLAWFLLKKVNTKNVILASVAGSVLFFVVTNFGVWAMGTMYPKNTAGVMACYTAAIPFFRNSLMGDLLWSGVLFGGFAFAQRRFPALAAR